MIAFLTDTLEVLKLLTQIVMLIGCILILLGIPFIAYYCPQESEKPISYILKIKFRDKKHKEEQKWN